MDMWNFVELQKASIYSVLLKIGLCKSENLIVGMQHQVFQCSVLEIIAIWSVHRMSSIRVYGYFF